MDGAEALIRSLSRAGVDTFFANPGTTEMHLVSALDRVPGVRAVLGLFEGVCTGAADGFGRMSGRPAATLLHLGPGFANGIANLHNARRAFTPVVNLIGDHPTWHAASDAPLASDIESLARPVSKWVRVAHDAQSLAADGAEAVSAALTPATGVASLIAPADCCWSATRGPAPIVPARSGRPADPPLLTRAATVLRGDAPVAMLLGGGALGRDGLELAGRIAAATGCRLFCDTFVARLERGPGLPRVDKLPYFPEQVTDLLKNFAHLILMGAREPVAFFGYRDGESRPTPAECRIEPLLGPDGDVMGALGELVDQLDASAARPVVGAAEVPRPPSGPLGPATIGAALASLQREGTIVVDEAATTGLPYWLQSAGCPPSSYLSLTGGAIGQGLPCAVGAALACPDRPVIAFQADGSGLYTSQALWTMARESLDVTTVICANQEYRILRVELGRAGIVEPGPAADALTALREPEIDWVALAKGYGVPAARAETSETLVAKLQRAFAEPGPHLIEARF